MGAPIKVEDHPDCHIPAAVQFLTLSRVDIPGSRTIETSGIYVHKLGQDSWVSKVEFLHQRIYLPNKLAPLLQDILAHGVVILECISKMFDLVDPGQRVTIQLDWEQILPISFLLTKYNAFSFGLIWIWICTKLEILAC